MPTLAKLENDLPDPLISEITSLKAALARYQSAADTANIHLQRQALDLSTLAAKNNAIEQENVLLQKEIAFLRSNPELPPSSSSTSLQISEMTLGLRRLSDQLNSSEEAFRDQAVQLTRAHNARSQARLEAKGAYELATRAKAREGQALEKIRTLEFDLKRKEEERKMADLVVREYADLVRTLEGRLSPASLPLAPKNHTSQFRDGAINGSAKHPRESSDGSSTGYPSSHSTETVVSQASTSADRGSTRSTDLSSSAKPIASLHEGRAGLQRLMTEFHEQTERLEEEIAKLHGEREILEMKLAVCEQVAADESQELASVKAELASSLRTDKSAARMVERYMSFSQQSTNLLQSALQTQKKRHIATIATLERQISSVSAVAEREKGISERLRNTLDEMALDVSRESFGRRRETTMRLLLMERERKTATMLEKWINDMERRTPPMGDDSKENEDHLRHISSAKRILGVIRGSTQETLDTKPDPTIQMALTTVQDLSKELESETSRRMSLERENADLRRSQVEPRREPRVDPPEISDKAKRSPSLAIVVEKETAPDILDKPREGPILDAAPPPSDSNLPSSGSDTASEPLPKSLGGEHNKAVSPGFIEVNGNASGEIPQEDSPPLPQSTIHTEKVCHTEEKIAAIRATSKRYENLQSAFNDCHDALGVLKSSMMETEGVVADGHFIAAVERLQDYCEDARVELEILVADEARISQGYETLLGISSGSRDSRLTADSEAFAADEWHLLDQKVDAFINGTLPSMQKAKTLFEAKLDNLMHDIAIIKRAIHNRMHPAQDEELSETEATAQGSSAFHNNAISFPSQDVGDLENGVEGDNSPSHFTSKTSSSSLIPASPFFMARPPGPSSQLARSFGRLMASGRPHHSSTHSGSAAKASGGASTNPLNHLGLRIAMPRVHSPHRHEPSTSSLNIHSPFPFALRSTETPSPGLNGQSGSAPISRTGSGWFSPVGISRARTISNIHGTAFGVGMATSPRHGLERTQSGSGAAEPEMGTSLAMEKRKPRASDLDELPGLGHPAPQQDEVE